MGLRVEVEGAISNAINGTSAENGSNTPDFVLAEYLFDCLTAFDKAVCRRDSWYGVALRPGDVYKKAPQESDVVRLKP